MATSSDFIVYYKTINQINYSFFEILLNLELNLIKKVIIIYFTKFNIAYLTHNVIILKSMYLKQKIINNFYINDIIV
jgi:hypothetical protein